MEVVPHAFLFSVHVAQIIRIGLHLYRNVFDHFKTVAFESYALDGIIGHQTHLAYPEKIQDLRTYSIVALVGSVAEVYVCFYGIKTFFLKLVCADFVHKSYAPAFLTEVDYGSAAFRFYHLHCFVQLLAAIASARGKNIAGST